MRIIKARAFVPTFRFAGEKPVQGVKMVPMEKQEDPKPEPKKPSRRRPKGKKYGFR